jgi:hypothetical protein
MADLTTTSRSDLEAERVDLNDKLARVEAEITSIKAELAGRLQSVQADAQTLRTRLGQVEAEIARRVRLDAVVPTISDRALRVALHGLLLSPGQPAAKGFRGVRTSFREVGNVVRG